MLTDGKTLEDVDVILFATGYLLSFPFCQKTDEPWRHRPLLQKPSLPRHIRDRNIGTESFPDAGLAVHNLDSDNIFYYPDPTVAFLALQYKIVPFPLAEIQARVVARRWSGRAKFEIQPGLDGDRTVDTLAKDEDLKATLVLAGSEFDYEDRLLRLIGEGAEGDDILGDGSFSAVSGWRRELRAEGSALKLRYLGH